MRKLFKGCVMVFVVLLALGAIADAIFFGSNGEERKEINLDNDQEVLSFIQGPWEGTEYASRVSNHIHFRIMIEGNRMKIWKKMGDRPWDMGEPDEFHTFSIGYKRNNVDGIPVRDVNFENPSLFIRSIAGLQIKSHGIWYSGAIRPLRKGDFGNYVAQDFQTSKESNTSISSQNNNFEMESQTKNSSYLLEIDSRDSRRYRQVLEETKNALKTHRFFDTSEEENSKKHKIYLFKIEQEKVLTLSFTSGLSDCRICNPAVSLQEFQRMQGTWKKTMEFMNFDSFGNHGNAPSKGNIEIINVAKEFMITVKTSHSGQGSSFDNLLVYFPINNEIKMIANITIAHDNLGTERDLVSDWKAIHSFSSKNGEMPIIKLEKTGLEEGKQIKISEDYVFLNNNYILRENENQYAINEGNPKNSTSTDIYDYPYITRLNNTHKGILRTEPNLNSSILTEVIPYEQVWVLEKVDSLWLKVRVKEKEGYITEKWLNGTN